jgi:hypothetical protein
VAQRIQAYIQRFGSLPGDEPQIMLLRAGGKLTNGRRPGVKMMPQTLDLTDEEFALLQQLSDRERQISGNKSHRDLARLLAAKYVEGVSTSMDTVTYKITDHGRQALNAVPGDQNPIEN